MPYHLDLFLLACGTSVVTAAIGIGGGLLLIAFMPGLVPPAAIVPLHAAGQVMSNASRAAFAWRAIDWRHLWAFVGGSLAGIAVFGVLLFSISLEYIPLFIGCYILLTTWSKRFERLLQKLENFFIIGLLQTGVGLVVGATGPLTLAVLVRELGEKEGIVATNALYMSISHLLKIVFFTAFTFSFAEYWLAVVMLMTGAVLGSWLGTLLRGRISGSFFINALKILLSLLAVRMIVKVLYF